MASLESKYTVQISFVITGQEDGKEDHSTVITYRDMDYEQVLQLEKFGAGVVSQLTNFGEAELAAIKAAPGQAKR